MRAFCVAILTRPKLWLIAWLTWFAVLWWLSSQSPHPDHIEIPHLDKVMHFGYFFGGAGLCYVFLHHLFPRNPSFLNILICTLIGMAVGALDEFHQSFVPGRFGNDLGDLAADSLGSLVGAIVMAKIMKWMLPSVPA